MDANTNLSTLEAAIARATLAPLLAAGYTLTVRDEDGDKPVIDSRDLDAVVAAIGETCTTKIFATGGKDGDGWVLFVHGNDEDVVSDFTVNLESLLGFEAQP
jgi:hypothetical protein